MPLIPNFARMHSQSSASHKKISAVLRTPPHTTLFPIRLPMSSTCTGLTCPSIGAAVVASNSPFNIFSMLWNIVFSGSCPDAVPPKTFSRSPLGRTLSYTSVSVPTVSILETLSTHTKFLKASTQPSLLSPIIISTSFPLHVISPALPFSPINA